jgi:hypothetical protein
LDVALMVGLLDCLFAANGSTSRGFISPLVIGRGTDNPPGCRVG